MMGAIGVLALITLALGMFVIWNRFGRSNEMGTR